MSILSSTCGQPFNITASGVPLARPCELLGFYVATTTGGTVVLHDSAATGTNNAISGTITPAAGAFHAFPASLGSGLRVVIANTINITLFAKPIG
jgi:hypothetical protein